VPHLSFEEKQSAHASAHKEPAMKRSLSLVGGVLAGSLLFAAGTAQAHIKMEGALLSRTPDGLLPGFDDAQKMSPCDGARSAGPVYTFQPGTTITLSISEAIPHPSYFRIAFDNDGEDGFKEPASIKPIDPSRACPFDKDDQCGKSDFCNVNDPNGARVLWDNLNPHASGGSTYSWTVTLPNMECENCTLQVIQVMEDTVHGAYCPQGSCAASANSAEDIYHRCINIKLKQGATNSPGVATGPASNMGMDCSKTATPDAGAPSPDAGAASDAGTPGAQVDASTASRDAGGPTGTPGGGTTSGTATSGGGTTSGTTTTPTGGTGGGGTTGGTATTGTTGGAGTGTTTSPVGTGAVPATSEDDGGCSIAAGATNSSAAAWLGLAAFGLFLSRRSRRRG
jgi:MYXO-CTERM domain-containing protein